MLKQIISRIINDNDNKLRQVMPIMKKINSLESEFEKLTPDQVIDKTNKWKTELKAMVDDESAREKYLNDILPEAFALVREVSKREMGQRQRDVQLIAGIFLHKGTVTEQKTGEGKTLTAIAPLYLNSLTGLGAHISTPNDYLSMHAPGWYGKVYNALGVSVGVIIGQGGDHSYVYDPKYINENVADTYHSHLREVGRKEAYLCDVTYGTGSYFGFDYLRDNMARTLTSIVQTNSLEKPGKHNFCIVDEVDSILIDVARTPLIISQPQDMASDQYLYYAGIANQLQPKTDYHIEEKERSVTLTELGIRRLERMLNVKNLYQEKFEVVHFVENALRAKVIYHKDKDYIVKDNRVIIIDKTTGRLLDGNRWSNGLHQAVEAKENVAIQNESKTIASISYQNYYRLYSKLAGMTGTAMTEAEEFMKMYGLEVVEIPTFKPIARLDQPDYIYKTEASKYFAIANDVKERNISGQPVLIGTPNVQKARELSKFLSRVNVKHAVLTAKNDVEEAKIIADAGKKGAVTVATPIAGRGVDIILGGDGRTDDEYNQIIEVGGLYVIGTERHDSRRIDNQLRGRSGRQGDKGESRFYLSLQDDLLRIFGGERITGIMNTMGISENTPIESGIITRAIENAQKKVEGINFDQRKAVVEYDDVINTQRNALYKLRGKILYTEYNNEDLDKNIEFLDWLKSKVDANVDNSDIGKYFKQYIEQVGDENWFNFAKQLLLETINNLWMEHIDQMDHLQRGIRLRGYAQVDPVVEYKREGKSAFEHLIKMIWTTFYDRVAHIQIERQGQQQPIELEVQETHVEMDFEEGEYEYGVEDEVEAIADGSINVDPQKLSSYQKSLATRKVNRSKRKSKKGKR